MSKLLAFCGYKHSGKTEATNGLLKNEYWIRHSFANPLKNMLHSLGVPAEQLWGDQKEFTSDLLCGKTARWGMQSLGEEWGRKCIGEDIWVNAWETKLPTGKNVFADDLRYFNEVECIRRHGGKIIRIERPGLEADTSHASERYVMILPVDMIITNDGSIEMLWQRVRLAVKELFPE